MPNISATTNWFAGSPSQVYIGVTDYSPKDAEPAYDGSMRVVAERDDGRVLLHNPLTGHYWDRRGRHGSWGVAAQGDAEAVRIFRERRW